MRASVSWRLARNGIKVKIPGLWRSGSYTNGDCFLKIFSGMMVIYKGNMSVKVWMWARICDSDNGQKLNFELSRKITFSQMACLIINLGQSVIYHSKGNQTRIPNLFLVFF